MNILLIQPQSQQPIQPAAHALFSRSEHAFSPDWNLLCLQAYICSHTRHFCEIIDCRTLQHQAEELPAAIAAANTPAQLLVVLAETENLPEVRNTLHILRQQEAQLPILLIGSFPSFFPSQAIALPEPDYIIAGDPEPALRNLMDHVDLPQRLRNTPGLISRTGPVKPPNWVPALHGLALPDWQQTFWPPYLNKQQRIVATARFSRGHSGNALDTAHGLQGSPFRLWRTKNMAACLQKCSGSSVSTVFFTDPPGIWTDAHLTNWMAELTRIRNTQPWGMQLFPGMLDAAAIRDLYACSCRVVDLLIPAINDQQMKELFGITFDSAALKNEMQLLSAAGIRCRLRVWLCGPQQQAADLSRLIRQLQQLTRPEIIAEAFPFSFTSPLYARYADHPDILKPKKLLEWLDNPWGADRPSVTWAGTNHDDLFKQACATLNKGVRRHPKVWIKNMLNRMENTNLIQHLEDRALASFCSPKSKQRP